MLAHLSIVSATKSEAAPLVYAATFSLELFAGSDIAGIDGAVVRLTANFEDGARYGNNGGNLDVFATASSHSIEISGASQPASNGVHIDPEGLELHYNHSFGRFPPHQPLTYWVGRSSGDSSPAGIPIGGSEDLNFRLFILPGANLPNPGDGIEWSQFGDANPRIYGIDTASGASYAALGFTYRVTGGPTVPVPEPTMFQLAGLAAVALILIRRCSRTNSGPH